MKAGAVVGEAVSPTSASRSDPDRRHRWLRGITVGALLVYVAAAVAFGLLFVNFTADDAYITFRYAKNLAATGDWSWNPAGHPLQDVEAYTNPLFAALAIPVHLLGWPPLLPFKLLGLVTLGLILRSMLLGLTPARKVVAAAFVCANFYVFPHAFSGLETDVFLLAALLVLNADEQDLGKPFFSSLILLAPLIRPEGALISAYILYMQFRRRSLSKWTGLAVTVGLIYMAWRVERYGQWFPNTYYAKTHGGASFLENLQHERHAVALGALSWFALYKAGRNVWLPTALLLGFVIGNLRSDMQMNYLHRFAYHTVIPVAFHAARVLLQEMDNPWSFKPWYQRGKLVCLAGMFGLSVASLSLHQAFVMLGSYNESVLSYKKMAFALRQVAPPSTIVALEDAGTLPYHAGLVTIDYVGLASREISAYLHHRAAPRLPVPDVIFLYSDAADMCQPITGFKGIQPLMAAFVKEGRYACVSGIYLSGTVYLNALIRKDAPKAQALADAVLSQSASRPRFAMLSRREILMETLRFDTLREDFVR